MPVPSITERLKKLRELRVKLCDKEKNWKEAFEARDWIVSQLQVLKNMSESEIYTKDDIKERIDDIICVFEPEQGEKDDK
jgi:uncharacterized protein (DUF2342 family)